jgi:hypothetical protein
MACSVARALALGSNQGTGLRTHSVAPTHAMNVVHANQDAAAKWLIERRDLAERRETMSMIVNVVLMVHYSLDHTAGNYQLVSRVSLMPATRHSSRELNGTDSRISGGFDLGAVASGGHALVGVGVSSEMIR